MPNSYLAGSINVFLANWQPPPPGRVKLNTDATSPLGDFCGVSVIIKNEIGSLVATAN